MKTIIDKNTGQVLFASLAEVELKDNEMLIDSLLTENFVIPYWDFENSRFYENATAEEISQSQAPILTQNELIIELVTKQVEFMSEDKKNELLQLLSQ